MPPLSVFLHLLNDHLFTDRIRKGFYGGMLRHRDVVRIPHRTKSYTNSCHCSLPCEYIVACTFDPSSLDRRSAPFTESRSYVYTPDGVDAVMVLSSVSISISISYSVIIIPRLVPLLSLLRTLYSISRQCFGLSLIWKLRLPSHHTSRTRFYMFFLLLLS